VGKHCGFVQFVRKVDAEKAIEKMQGFPIGGSRIRLSWGRSQCKLLTVFFSSMLFNIGYR
jgi:RNA recognition motif-containing protein